MGLPDDLLNLNFDILAANKASTAEVKREFLLDFLGKRITVLRSMMDQREVVQKFNKMTTDTSNKPNSNFQKTNINQGVFLNNQMAPSAQRNGPSSQPPAMQFLCPM